MFHELRQWSDYLTAQGLSQGTVMKYRYSVLRFLAQTPADSLAAIAEQDVVVFLASLGNRAHSKQLYIRGIRSFFEWAWVDARL
jgi:site-specific recombinase XerD